MRSTVGGGAPQLAELWQPGAGIAAAATPDAAIVAEPTELNVVVAHKGTVRWRCHTRGRAAHSSQPDQGRQRHLPHGRRGDGPGTLRARRGAPTGRRMRLLGRPTLSVGVIQGGISVNTVPDRCTIEIDRRLLPGEPPQAACGRPSLGRRDRCRSADVATSRRIHQCRGWRMSGNGPLARG